VHLGQLDAVAKHEASLPVTALAVFICSPDEKLSVRAQL
jgi:hypothetical protein